MIRMNIITCVASQSTYCFSNIFSPSTKVSKCCMVEVVQDANYDFRSEHNVHQGILEKFIIFIKTVYELLIPTID